MSLPLLMDVHMPQAVTDGLRRRGVDVLTAQEDGSRRLADPALLDRAAELGRAVFTQDEDFLVEAARRQESAAPFAPVFYAHQRVSLRRCLDILEVYGLLGTWDELANQVIYIA